MATPEQKEKLLRALKKEVKLAATNFFVNSDSGRVTLTISPVVKIAKWFCVFSNKVTCFGTVQKYSGVIPSYLLILYI